MCHHLNAGTDVSKAAPRIQQKSSPLAAVSGTHGDNGLIGITRRTQDCQRLAGRVVVDSFDRDNPDRTARLRKHWQGAIA
ncbi:MAG: hypothetical protein ACKVP7_07565 [Hyphomicrobiaceae bacterium]